MKNKTLLVNKKRIDVSDEVYKAYYKEREHERYLYKKVKDKEYSYENMKENGIQFEYNQGMYIQCEDEIIKKLEIKKLNLILKDLSKDERRLVYLYYFENKTEKEISLLFNLSQKAINKRKNNIIKKLRNFYQTRYLNI